MNALYSLVLVFALVLIALFGVGAAHMAGLFGIFLPLVAVAVFLVGFAYRIIGWAKSPVPFSIPTTAGQQKSLDFIKHDRFDNPVTPGQTFIRMVLEICCFRTLFRNTSVALKDGRVTYASAKWLWLFSLLFHYSFLLIVIRHMRLFFEPVPACIGFVEMLDGIMQIGVPRMYMSDLLILAGLGFLLARRLRDPKLRYISLVTDYFPLLLIIGIALSGIYMRFFAHVDVIAIKKLTMGLVTFSPVIPAGIDISFYVHLFLVCTLLIYFPFSKLMHAGGVFLSPTRNMPNDTRIKHHENPWNDPSIKPHSYADYEDDFREPMIEAGLPVDKKA
ncbi:sulfate reduction electron transfer complex DsrMKJOP subunit DsrM [Maridesulfovibrio hydrothermalis]|uniref:Hdr-like menaquinol oxidoreductase cytochrome b-like subunit n=1 Tax=Maridesulfovibrio hydrothermalis AM13 = DSM 14728 TaxID=1121451 RepID=L0R7T9_9BACT|nr:sulfate reduction electron transfer complex DsrMKJOP subunit DsrM [Maridesulfovibrio hydrothermalis]CCO22804.1 Hdr-like menaquinol oxidoreductase cytochrome b-like subunit [Maridesulfovibrio hydrothermalis AM13 = DSM 14728]